MSWDSSMRSKGENKTDVEMAHIVYTRFMSGDTKAGVRYSIGGLYFYPYIKYVSKEALKAIKEKRPDAIVAGRGIDHTKLHPRNVGVTFEHVVPVEVAYQYLMGMFRMGKLSEKCILAIMPKLFVAIVTKDENKELTKAGYHQKMPIASWCSANGDPLERYRMSGLNDDIWADGFEG